LLVFWVYVLKQSWRPSTVVPEGQLYPTTHNIPSLGHVYSYEDIKEIGQFVDTQHYIRGGLSHSFPELPESPRNHNGKREKAHLALAESHEPYIVINTMADNKQLFTRIQSKCNNEPTWRIQSRILLEDYGWPLHKLRDRLELLNVLRQAIFGKCK